MQDISKFLIESPLEVKNKLKNNKNKFNEIETSPPNSKKGLGKKRVIKISKSNKQINIIWCYEQYI